MLKVVYFSGGIKQKDEEEEMRYQILYDKTTSEKYQIQAAFKNNSYGEL